MITVLLIIARTVRLIVAHVWPRARLEYGRDPVDRELSGYSCDDEQSSQSNYVTEDFKLYEDDKPLENAEPFVMSKPVSQGSFNGGYCRYLEASAASKQEQADGWLSDDATTDAISTTEIEEGSCRKLTLAAMTSADDGDLYEDFKSMWLKNSKQLNPKLRSTLHNIFRQRPDVYAFLLHCARKSSARQSITKLVLSEFVQYKKSSNENDPIPEIQLEHQLEALQICTRSHPIIFPDMYSIFDLNSAPLDNKVQLIQTLLQTSGKHKEAVTYARKLNVQKHFKLEEMLLPLVVMDKINIIENYISNDQELQIQFVKILDNLCASGSDLEGLASYYQRAGVKSTESSKLTRKQLNKLAFRLTKAYGLNIEQFPNIAFSKASGSLHYVLHKYYKEGGISSDNVEDLIKATVSDIFQLQINLLFELMKYKDLPAAAYWVDYFNIESQYVPPQLQEYMKHYRRTVKKRVKKSTQSLTAGDYRHNDEFYPLNISFDRIHFIDDEEGLYQCQQVLCQQGTVIGVDAEWRLSACNAGIERMALLQLATEEVVYLLDVVALPTRITNDTLRDFITAVFSSKDTIKLGYGIAGDFRVLAQSWPFVAEIVGTPCNVIDLQNFAHSIKVAEEAKANKKEEAVEKEKEDCSNNGEHSIPIQCTSLNENAELMKIIRRTDSIPDNTELPSVSVSDNSENNEEHSVTSGPRGLSLLVRECFGKPLDKSQQLSDWERRPLKPEQMYYAALDAFCLLEVYNCLKKKALAISPDFNTKPFLTSSVTGKAVFKGQKDDEGAKKIREKIYPNPPKRTGPKTRPKDIKLVVDTMLQGLGRQLRSCGVDVLILTNDQHHYDAIKFCQQEDRIILTSGAPFNMLRGMVPEGMCIHVNPGKSRDQTLEVFDQLNIQVMPSDIFTRCQMCNSNDYVLLERDKMSEIFASLPDHVLNKTSLKLDNKELLESDETPSELTMGQRLLTDYPVVALNDGLTIHNGIDVMLNHTGVCLNIRSIPVGVLDHVDIFYCCSQCGKVYWEGKHYKRFIHAFHGVFDTNT